MCETCAALNNANNYSSTIGILKKIYEKKCNGTPVYDLQAVFEIPKRNVMSFTIH